MTTRRRHGRKPSGRAGPPKPPKALAAPQRPRPRLVAGILAAAVALAILAAAGALYLHRRGAAPTQVGQPGDQISSQAGSRVELTPQQKAEALKEEELRLAEQLVKEFPDSEEPLVLLGGVHRRRGQIDQAISLWEKALQINPQRGDVYDNLAHLAFQVDDYEKAISLWRKALEVTPTIADAHTGIATALMALGQYDESIPESQKEAALSPDAPLPYFLLGQAYQHLQDYEKARLNYEKAVELQPDHTQAHYGLYTIYARLKETEKAQRHLAEFQRLKQRDDLRVRERDRLQTDLNLFSRGLAKVCVGAHELYRVAGNGPKVEAMLVQAVNLDPNDIAYLEKLTALYRATNRIPEALELCRRIERLDPNNTACQLNIGKLSLLLGRSEDAEQALQRVVTLLPDHYAGYKELARLYLRTNKDLARARELAQKAVDLESNADTYFVLGWARDVNGDAPGAMLALEKAMALDPNNTQYRQAYQQVKRREESR